MSLFRIAVVLSLGVAVMPSDKAQQEALYERAATAAYWTMTYCDRNGPHCEMAGEFWDAFLRKAEFAGKLAYDVALRSSLENATAGSTSPIPANARGTLNSDDLRPDWRGDRDRDQGGA
jgi:hypothetical protein